MSSPEANSFDDRVLRAISAGADTFAAICVRIKGKAFDREVDRSLQRLKKSGKIIYLTPKRDGVKTAHWEIVGKN